MNPVAPVLDDPSAAPPRSYAAVILTGFSFLAWIGVMILSRKARAESAWPVAAVAIAVVLSLIPQVRQGVMATADRARHPTARARVAVTLVIVILSMLYLLFTTVHQRRDLYAKEQDESMYLVQAQMLARGHLSMPAHPHPDFFESYHIFARPRYAAIYFPGTALLYVPAVWLHIPPWVFSLAIAGIAAGLTYRITAELLDGAAGLLAAILLPSNIMFRHLSTMVMSHTVMLVLGLLMIWAWLRWRERRDARFAILLGLFAGWAAITRPVDALCFAVPIAIMMTLGERETPTAIPQFTSSRFTSLLLIVLAAFPFLLLQLIFNKQMTGELWKTPVTAYHDHYWPQVRIGFASADESYHAPPTPVPQFRDYYEHYILDSFRTFRHTHPLKLLLFARLPLLLDVAVPFSLLLIFLPTAIVSLPRDRRYLAFVLPVPLFLLGYAWFMFFRKHYGIVVFPAIYFAILLGMETLRRSLPMIRPLLTCLFTLLILCLAAAKFPEINHSMHDQISPTPILHDFNTMLASLPHTPALVFVTYHAEDPGSWSQEPVYNTDVAWPDDARVIRAHDLGARNIELISYYARVSPQRWVYVYDKSTRQLESLGPARDLASVHDLTSRRASP